MKHRLIIDPPVTDDERLDDALSAFGLVCERALEALELMRWEPRSLRR